MSKELEKDVEKLKQDISKFQNDLSGMMSDLGSLSHDKLLQTKENLKNAKQAFEGMAAEKWEHANEFMHDQGERAVKASREIVRDRPLTTIAVSFGAGLLAALLLERSRK